MTLSRRAFTGLSGATCALAACLPLLAATAPAAAQEGPFAGLAGSWSGTGSVNLLSGGSERIRCRATYAVSGEGSGLQQTLRCASDSYRFDITTNVHASGSSLSGSWSETTRGVSGRASGSVSPGLIRARVDAVSFSANLAVQTRGNSQSIVIRSDNSALSAVNITLAKR